jgi:type VI secretion system secreted protein Hcp
MVIGFHQQVVSPGDPSTGLATGKRIHTPFIITKEIDKSTPLLYSDLVNNENLMNWELQCFALKGAGVEVNNYTVNLTNSRVVDIDSNVLNNKMSENAQLLLMEQVNFVDQKIKWTSIAGGTTSEDDWISPVT